MTRDAAKGRSSAAWAAATRGVRLTQRKLKMEKAMLRTMVERPTPAMAETPRRPTKAVSISERRGSRARAPRAGRARAKISWLREGEEGRLFW